MLLLQLLQNYKPFDVTEVAMSAQLQEFLHHNSQEHAAFERELAGEERVWGHVTGSAWIVNATGTRTVLVHHAKLGRWLQPGGHCDGEANVQQVALREAREETGLDVVALQSSLFDVDVHRIPEYWNTPAHWHYDVRFLLQADDTVDPILSKESHAVRWVSSKEVSNLNNSASIQRMIAKTRIHFATIG